MRSILVHTLVVLILFVCSGCDKDKALAPDNDSPFAAPGISSRLGAEAQISALWLSGELVAPLGRCYQIRDDLALIRSRWGDSLSSVYFEFVEPWEPSQLVMGFTDTMYDSIAAGHYHYWRALNNLYDLDLVILTNPIFKHLKLTFRGVLNPIILAQAYADLPGVRFVEPNRYFGDQSMLLMWPSDENIVYFFRNAWGENCMNRCQYSEYWVFTVTDDSVIYYDHYPKDLSMPSELQANLSEAWSHYRK